MNTKQQDQIIEMGKKMLYTNEAMLETLSKMKGAEFDEWYPKIMKSVDDSLAKLQALINTPIAQTIPEDLTNYEQWQLERYGNILPAPFISHTGEQYGFDDQRDRFGEWMQLQHERQLHEYER